MRGMHGWRTWAVQGAGCCAAHATGVPDKVWWSDLHTCRSPTIKRSNIELPRGCCYFGKPGARVITGPHVRIPIEPVTTKHVHYIALAHVVARAIRLIWTIFRIPQIHNIVKVKVSSDKRIVQAPRNSLTF